MSLMPIHIAAGSLALIAGGVALYAAKGGKLHRQSGMMYLCAMLAMALSAIVIGLSGGQRFNSSQGALTAYLVFTAYLAVKRPASELRWVTIGGMLLALSIGVYDVKLGMEALTLPNGAIDDVPAAMMFVFGGIAFLAAAADFRFVSRSNVSMRYRVARHLCRMGVSLWIATASFFLGQADFIPEPLRLLPLLLAPVLLVLGATAYWIVRVVIRGRPWTSLPSRRINAVEKVV